MVGVKNNVFILWRDSFINFKGDNTKLKNIRDIMREIKIIHKRSFDCSIDVTNSKG